MYIHVKESNEKDIRLRLPNRLFLNKLSAYFLSRALKRKDIYIPAKHLSRLFRAMKKYNSAPPGWKLVEVHSADGEYVEITL